MEYERLSAEGVAAFKAGDYDEAVARFTDALVLGSTHDFLSAKQRFVYQNRWGPVSTFDLIMIKMINQS